MSADLNQVPILQTNTNLRHLRGGSGFPLVLVHGYLGGAAAWETQVWELAERFDVIAPELTGFGGSIDGQSCISINGFARQILDFLSDIDVERFHLLGHSMGGMIAQHMAVSAPERVVNLVCYGTGSRGVMPDRFETIDMSRERFRVDGVKTTARHIVATWFMDGENAEGYSACIGLGENVTPQTAMAGLSAMEAWDGRSALPDIHQPTLVLWGDSDQSYGWSQPEALWHGISGSNLAVMPGCGHNAHMEKPELFNAIVENFLPETP